MAKSFDFNKIKPKTMNVTLSDEKKTTLVVMTPDKKLKEELENLKNEIENADEDETLDILYDLTARLMSRNKRYRNYNRDIKRTLRGRELYLGIFGGLLRVCK